MRLRRVFHAFILWAFLQGAAAADVLNGGRGRVAEEADVECGVELIAAGGSAAWSASVATPLPPEPLDLALFKLADEESYMDVYSILKEENSCSRFFGGPGRAIEAFNGFASRLRKQPLGANSLSIRMSGSYTIYRNNVTGASFRLFERAALNSEGPFFVRVPYGPGARMRVGSFPITSRAARALTMLHELGHLVRGEDGRWLLPNDGGNPALSERNTNEVESRCLAQLSALKD